MPRFSSRANTSRFDREAPQHRDHAHALGAGGDHHVGLAGADAVGGDRDRVEPGRAEAVDRHPGHGVRQARRAAAPIRATFMPCSNSGIAQPTITSSTRAGIDLRHLRQHALAARARAASRGASTGTRRAAPCRPACAWRRRCRRPASVLRHGSSLLQFRSGLPVFSVCAMRSCVFALRSSAMNSARSRSSSHFSSTRLPASTSPPQRTRAIAQPDLEVVGRDEAAVAHVDQHHLERRDAGPAGDRDVARRQRRPVAGLGQRARLRLRDVQQLVAR